MYNYMPRSVDIHASLVSRVSPSSAWALVVGNKATMVLTYRDQGGWVLQITLHCTVHVTMHIPPQHYGV